VSYKHGFRTGPKPHPIYTAWHSMKTRCSNPKCSDYKYYGGRGIKVCDRWMRFENFRDDMFSAWQPGLQLDRINNDGNYEPENCRWVTKSVNTKNRRNRAEFQSPYPGITWDKQNKEWRITLKFGSQHQAEKFFDERKLLELF